MSWLCVDETATLIHEFPNCGDSGAVLECSFRTRRRTVQSRDEQRADSPPAGGHHLSAKHGPLIALDSN